MRATVLENLSTLEQKHQVKVLFACESGSRGWGFASPDEWLRLPIFHQQEARWAHRLRVLAEQGFSPRYSCVR